MAGSLTTTRYQMSSPTVWWGNFCSMAWKSASASSLLGSWMVAIVRGRAVGLLEMAKWARREGWV